MSTLGILIALAQSATYLTIQPWTGNDFQATSEMAAKYRLEVTGRPNSTLRLRAVDVSAGWLAAFCTPRLCSPQRIDIRLPASGNAVFQFELIRESDSAPKRSGATITDGDGASVTVPATYRG
jgi:hypothetical protein